MSIFLEFYKYESYKLLFFVYIFVNVKIMFFIELVCFLKKEKIINAFTIYILRSFINNL